MLISVYINLIRLNVFTAYSLSRVDTYYRKITIFDKGKTTFVTYCLFPFGKGVSLKMKEFKNQELTNTYLREQILKRG